MFIQSGNNNVAESGNNLAESGNNLAESKPISLNDVEILIEQFEEMKLRVGQMLLVTYAFSF